MTAQTSTLSAAERCVNLALSGEALREIIDSPVHHMSEEQRASYKAAVVSLRAAYRLADTEAREDYRLATEGPFRLDQAEAQFAAFLDDRAEGSYYGQVERRQEERAYVLEQAAEIVRGAQADPDRSYDESTNPSNGWKAPEGVAPQGEGLPRGQVVPNGHFRSRGTTLRVRDDWRDDKPVGGQVAYFLGEGNRWVGFAFVTRDHVRVWSKFRHETAKELALRDLLAGDWRQMGEDYAVASNRCWRCDRELKVPASIHRGLGPDCAKLLGR